MPHYFVKHSQAIIDSTAVLADIENIPIIPSNYSNYSIVDITINEIYFLIAQLPAQERQLATTKAIAIIESCSRIEYSEFSKKSRGYYVAISMCAEAQNRNPTLEQKILASIAMFKDIPVYAATGSFLELFSKIKIGSNQLNVVLY